MKIQFLTATINQIFLRVMEYCPISLLFSLPAVASDSTLTRMAEIATVLGTIVGLPLTILAIVIASWAFYTQKKDGKSSAKYTKKALKKQDEMIEQQKILGAWSLLAQKGTGDLGRKDALEFLHQAGKSLAGLDLSNAHLVGLELKGADLTGCNFTGASLTYAHFEGADLGDAHFEGAILYDAHFEGASLHDAHFEGAILCHAHFEGAILCDAHFEGADLGYAHFEGANLWHAKFYDADLGDAHFESVKWFVTETVTFKDCYVSKYSKELPTAPEGYEFIFDQNEDGTKKIYTLPGQTHHYNIDGTKAKIVGGVNIGYIVLTKNP